MTTTVSAKEVLKELRSLKSSREVTEFFTTKFAGPAARFIRQDNSMFKN